MQLTTPAIAPSDYWVNDQLNGAFDPRDSGLLSGLSVFETMRTYGTHIFRLADHYDRLVNSARALDITPPTLSQFTERLCSKAAPNVTLRYLLTGGGQEVIYRKTLNLSEVGRTIKLGAITVLDSPTLPGDVKHGSRAEWVLAAQQQGVDEVLLCSPTHEILEANRSAFLAISDGIIRLPPLDKKRLKSVTLGAVLDAIAPLNLSVKSAPIFRTELFDEAYVVSTLKGISPVISVEGRPIASPGPIGRQIQAAFKALVNAESP
jgi:branched-subunit amino acid aminotransferase/4-amino-4-deoxychorismate lyase